MCRGIMNITAGWQLTGTSATNSVGRKFQFFNRWKNGGGMRLQKSGTKWIAINLQMIANSSGLTKAIKCIRKIGSFNSNMTWSDIMYKTNHFFLLYQFLLSHPVYAYCGHGYSKFCVEGQTKITGYSYFVLIYMAAKSYNRELSINDDNVC